MSKLGKELISSLKDAKKIGLVALETSPDATLRELSHYQNQTKLLKLRGKITWEGDLSTSREGKLLQ